MHCCDAELSRLGAHGGEGCWRALQHAPSLLPFEWLISVTSGVEEPIHFIGGNLTASAAVRAGWTALRQAMRSWGVESELELSEWFGNQGFPAARPGSHISARGQEHVLTEWCREDARVALLEYVFVAITLENGRQRPREFPPSARVQGYPTIRNRRVGVPTDVPQDSWAQLDDVDLEVEFLRRVPMLKSCPHFLRGRFRHGLHITLQERCRAKLVGDTVGEERAWKAFGLVPAMMLHRPRGVGSIRRDELVERADKFSRGQWLELLGEYRSCTVSHGRGPTRVDNEERRRGQAACNRVNQGQVSWARWS